MIKLNTPPFEKEQLIITLKINSKYKIRNYLL